MAKLIKCIVTASGLERIGGKGNYEIGESVSLTEQQMANRVNKVVSADKYAFGGADNKSDSQLKAVTKERDELNSAFKDITESNKKLQAQVDALTEELALSKKAGK